MTARPVNRKTIARQQHDAGTVRCRSQLKAPSAANILEAGERGQIAALVHDAEDHRGVVGGGNPGEEYQMSPVGQRTQSRREQAPVAPSIRIGHDPLEGVQQPFAAGKPPFAVPGLDREAPTLVQIPTRSPGQPDRHGGAAI